MYRWVLLALLLLATPLRAQEPVSRFGVCPINMGQLVPEVENYVRSGNMGWEYACLYVQIDVGKPGHFYVGGIYSDTKLFVWKWDGELNRWSWRPVNHKTYAFSWVMPEVGYLIDYLHPLDFRINFNFIWPVATGYNWGAPVGAIPSLGVDASLSLWSLELGVKLKAAYKRSQAWTVLYDYTVTEQPTPHVDYWIFPVAITIGFRV